KRYRALFQKKSHYKLIEAMKQGNLPEKQEALQKRIEEIDLKIERLFKSFDSKGIASDASFKHLKAQMLDIQKFVKKYRDEIAPHCGKKQPDIQWEELNVSVERFRNLICDFYTVLTFEKEFGEATGAGIFGDRTAKILIEQIFGEVSS